MSDFSIRSSQLRQIKHKLILKDFSYIFLILIFLFLLTIYLIGYFNYLNGWKDFSFIYSNLLLVIIISILLFIINIPLVIFLIRSIKKDNRKFHQIYLDYLFDECRLEEIYYKFRKRNIDTSLYEELESYFSISKLQVIYSLTDASPTRLLDYLQVKYFKEKKEHYGVLMNVSTESSLDGFLQIRTCGEPIKDNYEKKRIQRFGFSNRNALSRYVIFSSLGSKTYYLDNSDISKIISAYQNYLKSNFTITYIGSTLSILIEDFQFSFTTNYFSYKKDDFDRKISSLIYLHKLSDELISNLKSFKA